MSPGAQSLADLCRKPPREWHDQEKDDSVSLVMTLPDVESLSLDNQPLARLRDCLGMYDNAMPARVMKNLRDFIETKPKNIGFSEDNGYPIPTGGRLEFKIYPRDCAVHVDRRHWWSYKWSWALRSMECCRDAGWGC